MDSEILLDLSTVGQVGVIGECMLELSEFSADSPDLKKLSFGGDTLNTAVYLARSGANVHYFTAVGDDTHSRWMIRQWQRAGVQCDHVVQVAGRVPGLYMIDTDPEGERSFCYWREHSPARELFEKHGQADQIFKALAQFDLIYLSGVTLSLYSDTALERLLVFLTTFRQEGGLVAFDGNYRPQGWARKSRAQSVYTRFYRQVDIALPTLEDEVALFDLADATALFELLGHFEVAEIVVKQGGQGCLLQVEGGLQAVPAIVVDDVIDTTGAGDSFNAGYLSARLNGEPGVVAAQNGHRYAAQVVCQRGAIVPIKIG
ncbi:MAG: sugar kinase [Halieaceae bacterium]|nr:sugar kinase [Halieaceae bacterium]